MKLRSRILFLAPLLLVPAVARAQVAPDKALSTFTVNAEGLELSLWASEEVGGFCNPTCIDVDHKGRVWVCESVNYRHTLHHQPPRRPEGDRILILEDTQGRGQSGQMHRLLPVAGNPRPARHRRRQGPGRPRLQGLRLPVARHPRLRGQGRRRQGRRPAEEAAHRLRRHRPRPRRPRHPDRPGHASSTSASATRRRPQNLQSSDGKGRKWNSNDTRLPGRHDLALRPRRHEPGAASPTTSATSTSRAWIASAPSSSPTTTTTATSRRASATSCPAATTATIRRHKVSHWNEEAARHRAENPAHLLRVADRHVLLRGDAVARRNTGASRCTPTPARARCAATT